MSTSDRSSSRGRRWMTWLGVLALAAVIGWLLSQREPGPSAPAPLAEASVPRARSEPAPSRPLETSAQAVAAAPGEPAPAAPIVDAIEVEKPEVCSGEDNLITVRAHTPDGTDAYLHYTVGTGTGQRVPLRVWRNDDGSYELPTVTVFGRNNVATTVRVPPYRVKDCEPERLVQVLSRRLPNSEDDFEFLAKVVERPVPPGQPVPPPFVPARYVWTFDEAPPRTSTAPVVSHTFTGGPAEAAMYLQHLVRVDVYDAQGRKVTGRSSLQRLNTSFENFDKKGIVTVLAVGTPRFPVLGEDGKVRQTFRLYHHFKGPVRLTRVTALRAFPPTAEGPPPPEQADAATLPVDVIPEGRGTEVEVVLDTKAEPHVFSITYALEGTLADGHPARGTFSVMRPPPRPTRENSTPVRDAVLRARIQKARELLRQEYVTDEDLLRLEREGRFAGLKVEAAPAGAASRAEPPPPASGRPRTR